MKIGIISDTHDHIQNTEKAVQIFKKEGIETVLHAGDFASPPLILPFKGLQTIAVFGNNDGDHYRILNRAKEAGVDIKGEFAELELDGMKFALYHGTNPEITSALISSGTYDVVICGHTHKAEKKKTGKTLFINPGTANGCGGRATIAIFDTKTKKVRFINL